MNLTENVYDLDIPIPQDQGKIRTTKNNNPSQSLVNTCRLPHSSYVSMPPFILHKGFNVDDDKTDGHLLQITW